MQKFTKIVGCTWWTFLQTTVCAVSVFSDGALHILLGAGKTMVWIDFAATLLALILLVSLKSLDHPQVNDAFDNAWHKPRVAAWRVTLWLCVLFWLLILGKCFTEAGLVLLMWITKMLVRQYGKNLYVRS